MGVRWRHSVPDTHPRSGGLDRSPRPENSLGARSFIPDLPLLCRLCVACAISDFYLVCARRSAGFPCRSRPGRATVSGEMMPRVFSGGKVPPIVALTEKNRRVIYHVFFLTLRHKA